MGGGSIERLIEGKEVLRLYLTDWQMRMVKDSLNVDCHILEIPIPPEFVVLYGVRIPKTPKVKKMYLTDWQKSEVMDEAGISCNFIELDEEMIPKFRYGLPTE